MKLGKIQTNRMLSDEMGEIQTECSTDEIGQKHKQTDCVQWMKLGTIQTDINIDILGNDLRIK